MYDFMGGLPYFPNLDRAAWVVPRDNPSHTLADYAVHPRTSAAAPGPN